MIDEREAYARAKAVAPYGDDALVAQITRHVTGLGHRILQIHKMGDDQAHVEALLAALAPERGAKILDAGCGVGEVARIMRRLRPDLQFTLLNVSPAQLAYCSDFESVCADFQAMPFPDGAFDAAIYFYSAGHGLLGSVMAEAARVVRPGGIVLFYDLMALDGSRVIDGLGYQPLHPLAVVARAAQHGLTMTMQWFPEQTDVSEVREMMGADCFDETFAGVRPAILRFAKLGQPSAW